jgi:hypothetical protein
MKAFLHNHPVLKWSASAVLGIFIVLAITVTLLDWNWLRGPIARMISAKTGHPTSIDGNLSAHLWSWNHGNVLITGRGNINLQTEQVGPTDSGAGEP